MTFLVSSESPEREWDSYSIKNLGGEFFQELED